MMRIIWSIHAHHLSNSCASFRQIMRMIVFIDAPDGKRHFFSALLFLPAK